MSVSRECERTEMTNHDEKSATFAQSTMVAYTRDVGSCLLEVERDPLTRNRI
jgi:hypothetical protein